MTEIQDPQEMLACFLNQSEVTSQFFSSQQLGSPMFICFYTIPILLSCTTLHFSSLMLLDGASLKVWLSWIP